MNDGMAMREGDRRTDSGRVSDFSENGEGLTPAAMKTSPVEAAVRWGGRTAAVALLLTAGCAVESDAVVLDQSIPCRVAQRLVPLPGSITESSGVAVSRLQNAAFWTHNDSGGEPVIYAVDPMGQLLGAMQVLGAENKDWEDIEIGPCGDSSCLYVADIGDNAEERNDIEVYRLPEPYPGEGATEPAVKFEGEYPDGPRDAEAFFVLAPNRMYVVTKGNDGPISLYKFPDDATPDDRVKLEHVRDLSTSAVPLEDRVTGAGANWDATRVAIRTRISLLLYNAEELVGGGEVTPANVSLQSLGEPQGEGVAFGPNGSIVVTTEGGIEGVPGMLGLLWCPDE